MTERRRVAAVTLNWRDASGTVDCLKSLCAIPRIDLVVVVDNESDGRLRECVDQAGLDAIVIEHRENRGFAGGTNPGLRAALRAGADYILAINNDARIDASAVDALVRSMDEPSVGAVGPTILNPDGTIQTSGVGWRFGGLLVDQNAATSDLASLTWACVLLRSDALRSVGLLDERFFMYWEDFEHSRRLVDGGWKLAVSDEAHVVHELSRSRSSAGLRLTTYSAWGLLTFMKLRRGADRRRALLRLAGIFGSRLVRGDLRGLGALFVALKYARFDGDAYRILADHPLPE